MPQTATSDPAARARIVRQRETAKQSINLIAANGNIYYGNGELAFVLPAIPNLDIPEETINIPIATLPRSCRFCHHQLLPYHHNYGEPNPVCDNCRDAILDIAAGD